MTLTVAQRAARYNEAFARFPGSRLHYDPDAGRINGLWEGGNNYAATVRDANDEPYYGAYPPWYLPRVMSLFPDMRKRNILHLFAGTVKLQDGFKGYTIDLDPLGVLASLGCKPDFCVDAEHFATIARARNSRQGKKWFALEPRLILADTPYSDLDAERYGFEKKANARKVFAQCHKALRPGGFLVWMDTSRPMWNKKRFQLKGTISIIRSSKHRYRGVEIFQRV